MYAITSGCIFSSCEFVLIKFQWYPKQDVCAAHIMPYANMDQLPRVGLDTSEVWNAKNGLLLHKSVEEAFDNRQVCFWWDFLEQDEQKKVKFRVLDPHLLNQPVVGNSGTTFGQLNNLSLLVCNFPNFSLKSRSS
jgi:hypothetical protein